MDSQTREAHAVSEKLDAYKLKPLDPLYIRFNGVLDQQFLEPVIDENGDINLLHIDEPVKAAGSTTSELEDTIEQLYIHGGIYRTISVNVTMTAKVYYVQGEVLQPGQFPLSSGTTLLQAIAGARGYTSFANRKKVTISRQGKIYTYNLIALEKDPSLDIKIEAGDVIKVWQSRF
jgi:polysaccharide export outer membrane protein|tara:strand:- start:740 stop:1264 length:525 start_codon:yes stop_codon:yes gene_type:complete